MATVVAILGSVQAAHAQEAPPPAPTPETATTQPAPEAPPPPPTATTTETSAPDPPPADTTKPEPASEPDPAPQPEATPAEGTTTTPDAAAPAPDAAKPDATPEPSAATDTKDVVKLEPEQPAPTPAAPAAPATVPTAPATTPQAAQPPSGAPPPVSIVLEASEPAAEAAKPAPSPAASPAAIAEEAVAAAALIVSLRARPAVALPEDEVYVAPPVKRTRVVAAPMLTRAVRQTCVQPAALVPLSLLWCKRAVRAVAISRVVRIYSASPEVRAAIDRAAAGMTARPVDARPPPESKAAEKKEHPVAKVRPTIPFGWSSGEGASHDGFSGSTGSSWSSRVFALAAVPLRVPRPFRFARIQLPRTIAHGVIAAPPPARPG